MLGVAHRIGQELCYWILPASGVPIARMTVHPFSDEDRRDPAIKERARTYDEAVKAKLNGERTEAAQEPESIWDQDGEDLSSNNDDDDGFEPYEHKVEMPEADDFTPETCDKYIAAQVLLPKGDTMQCA